MRHSEGMVAGRAHEAAATTRGLRGLCALCFVAVDLLAEWSARARALVGGGPRGGGR